MKKRLFFPQSVLSCFVIVNCGYKMDKKIASVLEFFFSFFVVVFDSSCLLAFFVKRQEKASVVPVPCHK